MTVKNLKAQMTRDRATGVGPANGTTGEGRSVAKSPVDATRAAARSARGVSLQGSLESVEIRARAGALKGSDALSKSVDSAALEVRAILARMRHLANRGASADMSEDDRSVIQDEFSMLQAEIDRVAFAASRHKAALSGVEPDNYAERNGEGPSLVAFVDRLTTASLGVGMDVADLRNPEEADWALVRIDAAEQSVLQLRDEFGTVEERIDAALARLADFVESFSPDAARFGSAKNVFAAAERVRLQLMHDAGVSIKGQARGLPKSVSSLLQ